MIDRFTSIWWNTVLYGYIPLCAQSTVLRKTMDRDQSIHINLVEYTVFDGYIPLGLGYKITRMVDHVIKLVGSVDIYTASQQKLLNSSMVKDYFTT